MELSDIQERNSMQAPDFAMFNPGYACDGMMFKFVPERPEFTAYVERFATRPALQRANAKDQEAAKG